jgi:oxygen-dependent protoporphyrinogen oxidase
MSNIVHGYATGRQPGSSIMTFSPGNLARKLMELDDDAILATYEQDLAEVLPGFGGTVVESEINRWPIGSPYCFRPRGACSGP